MKAYKLFALSAVHPYRKRALPLKTGAMKRCAGVGVTVKSVVPPADVPGEQFFDTLRSLNDGPSVHGILLFRPLPPHIDGEKAL